MAKTFKATLFFSKEHMEFWKHNHKFIIEANEGNFAFRTHCYLKQFNIHDPPRYLRGRGTYSSLTNESVAL